MRKTLCRHRVSVLALVFLLMGGCGVSLEEPPKITGVLKEWGVDPGNPNDVQSFENGLLSGVEVKYDLTVQKVDPPAMENRSFFDGTTGIQREVEVVRFAGYGTRDGIPSAYTGDLYIFDHTGDVWTTLVWMEIELRIGGEVINEEGWRVSARGKGCVSSRLDQSRLLYCGCDVVGGTVNGKACTEQQCQDLTTCKKKKGGGTVNGSCFLGATAR
ncbi:MAG: hypothetical protein WBE26_16200 [Phycisphaerae bacterium]